VDFIFVGQVVADRGGTEIAGLDQGFDGLDHRKLEGGELILRVPGSFLFEVGCIFAPFLHRGGDWLIGDGDKTLRTSFGAAGVPIDLDKSVVEIDGGVVLNPGGAEGNPLGVLSRLIEADQVGDRLGLRGFCIGARFLKAIVGFLQKRCIQPWRNLPVGSSCAVDKFFELAIWPFNDPRVQRVFS
jgi:hypothetical protein